MTKKIEIPIYNIIWHLELGFNCCLCFSLILRFILSKRMSKPPVFADENWRFWSGLRDLNPRSPGPKPGAIPNFAKPGYSIGIISNMVKGYFRPKRGRSQGGKCWHLQNTNLFQHFMPCKEAGKMV